MSKEDVMVRYIEFTEEELKDGPWVPYDGKTGLPKGESAEEAAKQAKEKK